MRVCVRVCVCVCVCVCMMYVCMYDVYVYVCIYIGYCHDTHGEHRNEGARRRGLLQMNRLLIKQKGKELRQAGTYT